MVSLDKVAGTGFLLAFLLSGCGGRSVPAPSEPPFVPTPAEVVKGSPWEASPTDQARAVLVSAPIPPPPHIRVGLTTRADAVRLTSSGPIRVQAGSDWVESHDILVEMQFDVAQEGRVYRVQVGSFLSRSGAERYLTSLEQEFEESGQIVREPVTGRFAVRVGHFGSASGAERMRDRFEQIGLEAARVVVEPSTSYRPRGLTLRGAGAGVVWTPQMAVLAFPREPGVWIEADGSPYRGLIEISVNASNRFTVVNILNLEDYLKGVVPAELSPAVYPQLEAIKAQAVAARTYAIRHLGQYAAEGFDICATPACQVYGGVDEEQRMGNEAVAATRGEVLTFEGDPIDALYTSTCGGRTEDVENVFSGTPRAYLVSRSCFWEEPATRLISRNVPAVSFEVAGALVLGVAGAEEVSRERLELAVTASEVSQWAARALARLGQKQCHPLEEGNTSVTEVGFARGMTGFLCWEGRLPFLLSPGDAERLVPAAEAPGLDESDRLSLAHWIRERWIRPPSDGLDPERPLNRAEVLEILYRVVASQGRHSLTEATVLKVDGDGERIVVDSGGIEENLMMASRRFLYRRVEDNVYFASGLSVLPGDRVLFHRAGGGVDLLVLDSPGVAFDRSSRFSRWTVRRTSEEITMEVNAWDSVGPVVDLRPKRYGRSGRVAELEVVGEQRSVVLRGLEIRRRLGIRDNLFFIDRQTSSNGNVDGWVFTGRGWGHGVGLCQVGSYGMAMAGFDYVEILSHYYPGTEIVSWKDTMLDK